MFVNVALLRLHGNPGEKPRCSPIGDFISEFCGILSVSNGSVGVFRGVSVNVQDLAPSSAGALYGQSHFILHNCADVNLFFPRFNLFFCLLQQVL